VKVGKKRPFQLQKNPQKKTHNEIKTDSPRVEGNRSKPHLPEMFKKQHASPRNNLNHSPRSSDRESWQDLSTPQEVSRPPPRPQRLKRSRKCPVEIFHPPPKNISGAAEGKMRERKKTHLFLVGFFNSGYLRGKRGEGRNSGKGEGKVPKNLVFARN